MHDATAARSVAHALGVVLGDTDTARLSDALKVAHEQRHLGHLRARERLPRDRQHEQCVVERVVAWSATIVACTSDVACAFLGRYQEQVVE